MNTKHTCTFMLKKIEKNVPFMPHDLVLKSIHIASNYPCLELIFMVTKVFEPLKFDCIWIYLLKSALEQNRGL